MLRGRGFLDLLEHHLDTTSLPGQGGGPFTLVVTLGYHALASGVGAGTLETGERLSAGAVRRPACRAGIIPMVLGGDSVVLDVGRERRLYDRYQRLPMAHTHGGCATEGCDRPPPGSRPDHEKPWHRGGNTNLADGIPLCPPHHHMADHPDHWDMHTLPPRARSASPDANSRRVGPGGGSSTDGARTSADVSRRQ